MAANKKRRSSLKTSKFSHRRSWNLWKRTKVFTNFRQICQIKDFKIFCGQGFEVECFVWENPGKNYDDDDDDGDEATSFDMETNYFISNKPKYFRKIHFD